MLCSECKAEYEKLAMQLAAGTRDSEMMLGAYQRKLSKQDLAEAFGLSLKTIRDCFDRTEQRVIGYCATKHGKR